MKIAVIGTGYVGLVTGVCLATKGHYVRCFDKNKLIVNKLNNGELTFFENNLQNLLKKSIKEKKFIISSDLEFILSDVSVIIIAVGTPSQNGEIDLTNILEVSKKIGEYISKIDRFISIVIKSTVVPGTTDTLVKNKIEEVSGKKLGDFGLGMNPEFLREGTAVEDFMFPDRIVIGYEDEKTLNLLKNLYKPWKVETICVNSRTAELIKYANNILLATQISTINEIANYAKEVGDIDISKVIKGVHLDKRWNPMRNNVRVNPEILKYLIPGCGFGGSCFGKDVQAIKTEGKKMGLHMNILRAILDVNETQPYRISKLLEKVLGDINNKKILILGLSFKPDTDDVRESPSIKIVSDFIEKGCKVYVHDPMAVKNFKIAIAKKSSMIIFTKKWQNISLIVDAILLVTPWNEYYSLMDLKLRNKVIFDIRGVLDKNKFSSSTYLSI